jgi:hypothetical protein
MARLRQWTWILGFCVACSDGGEEGVTGADPLPLPRASFDVSGRILGPVQSDDDSDIEFRISETSGVAGHLNFIRLTCNNRASFEWGAASFIGERGTNRIEANAVVTYVRHYTCPSSGRPQEILADLDDVNGNRHQVKAAPFHPDWPGS